MQQISPAAERNKSFIFEALNPYLPRGARVLEIASGTGQHAAYICQQRPDIVWQPTDPDPLALQSIESFRLELELNAMLEPLAFNIMGDRPSAIAGPYDLLVNINMIHISPWKACLGLLDNSAELLKTNGTLYFYGPFFQKDVETAPSNIDFDRSLRKRDPLWGLRNLDDVVSEAERRGFRLQKVLPMPANNLSVIFQKAT